MAREFMPATAGYMREQYPNANNVVDQGFVSIDTTGALTRQGGFYKESVFKEDIKDAITAPTLITSASTSVTPSTLDSYKVRSIVVGEGFAISEQEYNAVAEGSNANSSLAPYVSEMILRHRDFAQANLKRIMDGAFATSGTLNATHYSQANLSVNSGLFSLGTYQTFLSTLFGEHVGTLDAVITNQLVLDQLLRYEIAGYQDTAVGSSNAQTEAGRMGYARIPMLLGRPIIVNDTLCPAETISSADAYPILTIGGQPFGMEYQQSFRLSEDFKPAVGGGSTERYFYVNYAPSIKGLTFNQTELTGYSDLTTVGNWTKKWNNKNIKITKYMVRL